MKFCKDCEKFIGAGDWDLCCKEPHPEAVFGFLCYEDTPACDLFEEKKMLKLWIDDVRPAPEGYLPFRTVNDTLRYIRLNSDFIDVIDLDHDAGDCAKEGGDYINILHEMERLTVAKKMDFSHIDFRLHSMNSVGVANMRRIIERNGWKEVF